MVEHLRTVHLDREFQASLPRALYKSQRQHEQSFTGTATLYGALKPWKGGELYWVPEVISERPLSGLRGLGGSIQNFELQKQGTPVPTLYSSRLYFRQNLSLGGFDVIKPSGPMQLGSTVKSRRIVITLGNFSVLDIFDKNTYASDLRRQFFNMSFLTYAAFDFAADARGYTWGGAIEAYVDDFAIRFAHVVPPVNPNQLELDPHFWKYFGQQVELEHQHSWGGLPGAVRVLGYRNVENMGQFSDAIAAYNSNPSMNATTCTGFNYGSHNATAPDLCWARRPNVKMGIGASFEQALPGDIGFFLRAMYSDGKTEVYSYTSTDSSVSTGFLARGTLWRRPADYAGVGYSMGWISAAHAEYLRMGGVDGFIGDGNLRRAPETVFEVFYGFNIIRSLVLSGDYQMIWNPAYNADRGPVTIIGLRLHAEF